jgi:subtilase family serine protease
VTIGTSAGRAVPDLSADADPFTGYAEYFTGFTGSPLEDGWGGTSFVAPQLAGAAAVINSYVGHRTGFWNPALYRFAAGKGSPFTPLASVGTGNDNLYFTGRKGDRYNPATGLGVPNLARLAALFKG